MSIQLSRFRAYQRYASLLAVFAIATTAPLSQVLAQGTAPDEGVRFQPPKASILRGGTLVISPERTLEGADLLIRDGRIIAVGKELTAVDAEEIDCRGKHLYAAFVDCYVKFPVTAETPPAASWNQHIQAQRKLSQLLKPAGAQLDGLRRAGIGVALAAPTDGLIRGQSCVITTSDQALQQTLLRATAFQHIQLHPERRSRSSYPSSPMGAVALVRQTLLDANWYQQAWQAFQASPSITPPETNVALAELEKVIRGQQPVMIEGDNDLYALRADRIAREFSLNCVIHGSGREYRQLDELAMTGRKFVIPVNFADAPQVATRTAASNATLQSLLHWHLAAENPARMEKAGIDFVFTSDGLERPSELLKQVRLAIEKGLSETAALAALTTRPAKMLEVDRQVGSLEVGKLANIVIASGPLFDKKSKHLETWIQGQRYEFQEQAESVLNGDWKLVIEGVKQPLTLKLSGDEKLKGELVVAAPKADSKAEKKDKEKDAKEDAKEQKIELKDLKFDGLRLTANFDIKSVLDTEQGIAFIEVVFVESESIQEFSGTIQLPTGELVSFEAVRTDKEPTDSSERPPKPTGKPPTASNPSESKSADGNSDKENVTDELAALKLAVPFPLGAYGRTVNPAQREWLVIQNAVVWTCGDQGTLDNCSVLIHRGIIEAVGEELDVPEDAVVIDAAGMHLTPGIIDCHSHMATDGGVNEGSQAVTSEVRIGDFIDPTDISIYRQLAGGVTTANVLHGSANPIGGQNQVIKLRWGVGSEAMKMNEAPSGIKFALGENVKRANFESTDPARYPYSRMGVEQIMRDRLEAALVYREKQKSWATSPQGLPPRRDLELEAIAEILEGQRWIHCHCYRQDEILTFLRLLEEYGITVGSLQHILEGYKVADAMAKHGATGSSFSDWWAYKVEVFDAIPFNGALMHKAGVIVSFNSDDDELARHLNHEAAKAVKYGGLSSDEALKFVTLNPAKQLRIDDYVGSIEVGKQADFVLWNGSPLSTLSVCNQTWIDGRKYFDRDEDLERRKSDAELHRQLVQRVLSLGAKQTSRSVAEASDPSTWWVRYDEFCHHGHDHDDEHQHADE